MTTDGEREVKGLTLVTNAEMVAAVLRGSEDPATQSVMAAIAATRTLDRVVGDTLHALFKSTLATVESTFGEFDAFARPHSR